MRGISFSSVTPPTTDISSDPSSTPQNLSPSSPHSPAPLSPTLTPQHQHHHHATAAPSATAKMIKKLSTSFRRRTSFSTSATAAPPPVAVTSSSVTSASSSSSSSTSSRPHLPTTTTNQQQQQQPRAMTFSVAHNTYQVTDPTVVPSSRRMKGSTKRNIKSSRHANHSSNVDIPFFRDDRSASASINVVRVNGRSPFGTQNQDVANDTHTQRDRWASDSKLSLAAAACIGVGTGAGAGGGGTDETDETETTCKQRNMAVLQESKRRNNVVNAVHKENGRPPRTPRHRYFSFDADVVRKASKNNHHNHHNHNHNNNANAVQRRDKLTSPQSPLQSIPQPQPPYQQRVPQHVHYEAQPTTTSTTSASQQRASRRKEGQALKRRWYLPLSESPDKPRVFTPTPTPTPTATAQQQQQQQQQQGSTNFEMITRPRDRAEARTLASVCTFLEAEINRMEGHMHTHRHNNNNNTHHHCTAECAGQCPLNSYLPPAVDRLRKCLYILEDRYDSVEELYVKSSELSKAMGKFLNVSPQHINNLISTNANASETGVATIHQHRDAAVQPQRAAAAASGSLR